MDHLGTLNDETPRIRIGQNGEGMDPEVIFGLDTGLWEKSGMEGKSWAELAGSSSAAGWHGDEVETRAIRRGGRREKKDCGGDHVGHEHGSGCSGVEEVSGSYIGGGEKGLEVVPINKELLDMELSKLSFEIYRGKLLLSYSQSLYIELMYYSKRNSSSDIRSAIGSCQGIYDSYFKLRFWTI